MQEQNSANLLVGRSGVMDPTRYMLRDLISQGTSKEGYRQDRLVSFTEMT